MINVKDLFRFIDPLKRKIYLMIGRAIITAINNGTKIQKIQVTALKDETISDIERMQEYGFETYPLVGAEAVINFVNGNRDQGLMICVHDNRYRPTDLASGDVRVYDYNGNKIKLESTGIDINSAQKISVQNSSKSLKTELDALIDAIVALTVTCAAPGAPSSPPINAASFTAIKTNLGLLLK